MDALINFTIECDPEKLCFLLRKLKKHLHSNTLTAGSIQTLQVKLEFMSISEIFVVFLQNINFETSEMSEEIVREFDYLLAVIYLLFICYLFVN